MAWAWAAATRRGTSHVKAGTRCQDASRTLLLGPDSDVLLAVASDGAGSATFGGEGAAIICRNLTSFARDHFRQTSDLPDDDHINAWLDAIRDRISTAAAARAALPRDFAATLVAAIVAPSGGLIAHVGDGAAIIERDAQWEVGSWPASGEYASTTFFVTDDPQPQLRLTRLESPPTALAIFTDGIERLVLDFAKQEPHRPFFDAIIRSVRASDAKGRDGALCWGLGAYLDSDPVNSRTDDDKTLILAVWR